MDQFVVVSHMAHWPELITHSTAAYAKLVTGLQGVAHGHKSNFKKDLAQFWQGMFGS